VLAYSIEKGLKISAYIGGSMKQRFTLIALALFAVLQLAGHVPARAAEDVTITAKNFSFSPAVVRLKKGEPVVFHLRAAQGVHGLNAPEVGIYSMVLTAKEQIVHATPSRAGVFVIHCSIVCGTGHHQMEMTFIVR
jgi:cytochrome c oxidase subunit II